MKKELEDSTQLAIGFDAASEKKSNRVRASAFDVFWKKRPSLRNRKTFRKPTRSTSCTTSLDGPKENHGKKSEAFRSHYGLIATPVV